jgi:fucose 4-O-acetylase-like acetyltransferase
MEREIPTDIAKGIGIILVVAGHTFASWNSGHDLLYKFIYAFHMPFFLGLGGIYIRADEPLGQFIKAKLVRLIIPFMFWSLFYLCLTFSIQVINNGPAMPGPEYFLQLLTVPFYGDWQSLYEAGIYVDLWFLPALFSTVLLTRFLIKWSDRYSVITNLVLCYLLSLGVILLNYQLGFRPFSHWGMDVAVASLPFVYLCKLRSYFYRIKPLFIPPIILVVYAVSRTTDVSLAVLKISSYSSFIISASAGIVLVFAISGWIQRWKLGYILQKMGERSYLVFLLTGAILTLAGPIRRVISGANDDAINIISFMLVLTVAYFTYPFVKSSNHLALLALGENTRLPNQRRVG